MIDYINSLNALTDALSPQLCKYAYVRYFIYCLYVYCFSIFICYAGWLVCWVCWVGLVWFDLIWQMESAICVVILELNWFYWLLGSLRVWRRNLLSSIYTFCLVWKMMRGRCDIKFIEMVGLVGQLTSHWWADCFKLRTLPPLILRLPRGLVLMAKIGFALQVSTAYWRRQTRLVAEWLVSWLVVSVMVWLVD